MKRSEMLTLRKEVATSVAAELFAMEAAVDEALNRAARLTGRLATGRLEAGLSAVVGQPAFQRSTELVAMLGGVRAKAVEAHFALKDLQDSIGVRHTATGGHDKPEEPIAPAAHGLALVTRAA